MCDKEGGGGPKSRKFCVCHLSIAPKFEFGVLDWNWKFGSEELRGEDGRQSSNAAFIHSFIRNCERGSVSEVMIRPRYINSKFRPILRWGVRRATHGEVCA